jgi:hypothetical protein
MWPHAGTALLGVKSGNEGGRMAPSSVPRAFSHHNNKNPQTCVWDEAATRLPLKNSRHC